MNALQRFAAQRPRAFGGALIAFALLLLAVNYAVALCLHAVSRGVLGGSFALLFLGMWALITGRTDPAGNSAPTWWIFGGAILVLLGFGVGVYVVARLS